MPRKVSPCDQEFGCLEIGPGEPIHVGTLLSASGPLARFGESARNGARLAADFLSPPGQLLGHPIEWIDRDDQCGPRGHYGAGELAADVEVAFVIGTTCSDAALGWADALFSDTGIVLISPSNTSPANTDPAVHQPFYLRVIHNDKLQSAAMADFAFNRLGARRASTIDGNTPHSGGMQEEFVDVFRRLGGSIAAQEGVHIGDTEFGPLLRRLATDEIDFLYLPIQVDETNATTHLTTTITQQAGNIRGLERTVLARSDSLASRELIATAAVGNAEGTYVSEVILPAFEQNAFYRDEVRPAYETTFGEKPKSADHAYAFDAARLVFEAIEKVAIETSGGRLRIPRAGLRDALYATEDFAGLTGDLTCNKDGDCQPAATVAIYQIRAGEFGMPIFQQTLRLEDS